MIQLENVHKSYGQTKVLKVIDLQIQDQDDVVISTHGCSIDSLQT